MTSIGWVSVSAVGDSGATPSMRGDPRRDAGGVAVEVERVHAHVVPAESAQDLRPQSQRLAQRLADRLGVALDDDRLAVVLRDERQQPAVVHVDGDAEAPQFAGERPGQRVGEIFEAGSRASARRVRRGSP